MAANLLPPRVTCNRAATARERSLSGNFRRMLERSSYSEPGSQGCTYRAVLTLASNLDRELDREFNKLPNDSYRLLIDSITDGIVRWAAFRRL